ncbi:MAG: endonuclease [Pseudooceanicola sp.]|nr:endonuclease [Pseudooceanicola sp.]|tara:strand:+ start:7151 stop:7825 length:675 start_codon:yes stop_codon:yes gene_type:complete
MKSKKTGIIYSVTHKQSGEKYIGATTYSLRQRQLDHTERAIRGEDGKLFNAIATYGPEAFAWETIDTAENIDELAQKEKQYVLNFKSNEIGYNSDSGGGFQKSVYQYSKPEGNLIQRFDSLQKAAHAVSASKSAIGSACIGTNRSCKDYFWSYILEEPFVAPVDKRRKKIIQLSLSGLKVATYESVAEASRKSGISKTCIARCCRGERENAGGSIWKYRRNYKN